jgi:hypothetical protein
LLKWHFRHGTRMNQGCFVRELTATRNERRYACGLVPTIFWNRSRSALGDPNPTVCAIDSTEWRLVSSRHCALLTRARSNQCSGGIPS